MGPGFGEEIGKSLFWFFVLVVLAVGGTCGGVGYGCAKCDYRPHFEMRKVDR